MALHVILDDVERSVQIESHIAELLTIGRPAAVPRSVLEDDYTILDATEGAKSGSLHEKCAAIVAVLHDKFAVEAEYSVLDGDVVFVQANCLGHVTSESSSTL
jgi:hypothetical protein